MTQIGPCKCDTCGHEEDKDTNFILVFPPGNMDALHFCCVDCLKKWIDEVL
jgi:hypothetical protein